MIPLTDLETQQGHLAVQIREEQDVIREGRWMHIIAQLKWIVQNKVQMGGGCSRGKRDPNVEYCKAMFSFQRIVGKGGFGRVWKVKDKKTKTIYALKVIDKARVISKKSVSSIINERQILSALLQDSSNFIVNMRCAFQDRENLYLLLDYMNAGDLRFYINKGVIFNEEQIKFLVRCLMEGLRCLHKRNIIHRDIKPENVIIDTQGYARITDLGIARYWKPQNAHQTSGTPGYMAPEVLLRQNHSFCADFYAVGVIAYELLVGNRPYSGRDRKTIRQEMLGREAKVPPYLKGYSSQECHDFINGLLQRTPKKRLGFNGLSQIFNHPWLACSPETSNIFSRKEMESPIVTTQVISNQNIQQNTQPDDLWRENMLLLKRHDIQMMFDGYDFTTDHKSNKSDANSTSLPTTLGNKAFS